MAQSERASPIPLHARRRSTRPRMAVLKSTQPGQFVEPDPHSAKEQSIPGGCYSVRVRARDPEGSPVGWAPPTIRDERPKPVGDAHITRTSRSRKRWDPVGEFSSGFVWPEFAQERV